MIRERLGDIAVQYRFRKSYFPILIGALLGGCSFAPDIPDEDRISMIDVVDRARCELKNATNQFKADPDRDKKIARSMEKFTKIELDKNDKDYPDTRFALDNQLDSDQIADIRKKAVAEYEVDSKNEQFKVGNFLNTLAAQFEMTLQVKDTTGIGSNAASGTWGGIPIPFGAFSLKAAGGLQGTSRRTAKYKVSLYLREARAWTDDGQCHGLSSGRVADIRINGAFGVDEFISRAIKTAFATDNRHFSSMSTTLDFTLTPTFGVTPTWAITRPSGRTFNGTFTLGAQRDYENILDFVIVPIADPGANGGVTKVLVTNLPPDLSVGLQGVTPQVKPEVRPEARKRARADRMRQLLAPKDLGGKVDPFTQQKLDNELFRLQIPRTLLGQ